MSEAVDSGSTRIVLMPRFVSLYRMKCQIRRSNNWLKLFAKQVLLYFKLSKSAG